MLGLPFGQMLVGAVGLGIIMSKSFSSRFTDEIGSTSMSADMRRVITLMGRVGYAAKGVAFAIVGLLLVYAAATFDPAEAKGLDGAMRTIAEQPFGQVGLTAVAVGFLGEQWVEPVGLRHNVPEVLDPSGGSIGSPSSSSSST